MEKRDGYSVLKISIKKPVHMALKGDDEDVRLLKQKKRKKENLLSSCLFTSGLSH